MDRQVLTPALGTVQAWLDGVVETHFEHEAFVYHRGYLAFDRAQIVVGSDGIPKVMICKEVDDVAKAVWAAHERGEVVLSQRRLGKMDWLYLMQRSRRKR